VEGTPGWLILGIFVVYGLAVVALLPALAAAAFLLAGRSQPARALFAVALLGEAVVWAAFCFLLLPVFSAEYARTDRLLDRLPIGLGLTGLSLLLAGCGQFVAALRGPRRWAAALGLAAGAVLVILAGTSGRHVLPLPEEWLDRIPDWYSLQVALTSLPLAAASLLVAVLRGSHPGRAEPAGPRTGGEKV
jgi:hypothetical protein